MKMASLLSLEIFNYEEVWPTNEKPQETVLDTLRLLIT